MSICLFFHSFQHTTVKVQTKDSNAVGGENYISNPPTSLDGAFQDGTLVLCNPGTSSVLNPDSDTPHPSQTSPLHTVAPQGPLSDHCHGAHTLPADCRTSETPSSFPHPVASVCHPKDLHSEVSKYRACKGHRGEEWYLPVFDLGSTFYYLVDE